MIDIISMGKWDELRSIEQLVSLRHLPPNTWLPKPSFQADNKLVTDLLQVPDESDPLAWLKQNKNDLIAKLLLWTALKRIRSFIRSANLADRAGYSTPFDAYEQWMGNLLHIPEDAELFHQLKNTHPATVSSELLRSSFQELHTLRGRNGGKTLRETTNNEIWFLLDDLFQQPETADPLQRVKDEHNHLAAIETVRYAIARILPPRQMLVGKTAIGVVKNTLHPAKRVQAEGVSVELREIAFGQSSFALSLQTRVSSRRFSLPRNLPGKGIWWQGVERVTDDLGHHYLICHRPEEGGNRRWWFNQSLQLICYPALDPAATEITLNSHQMTFVVVGIMPGEQSRKPRVLHQMQIGDLVWRVQVG